MSRPGDGRRGLTPNERRARTLLVAGALGGHAGAFGVIGVAWVIDGPTAALWAAVGAFVTIAFYTVGLATQVLVADAPPRRVLFASMLSYGVRVGVLGLGLAAALARPDVLARINPMALFAGTVTVVACWLAAEFVAYGRMRIPIYDEPDDSGRGM